MNTRHGILGVCLLIAGFLAGCGGGGGSGGVAPTTASVTPDVVTGPCAVARIAAAQSDLITGPLARSAVGDFVLENDQVRVIVQKPGRNWLGIAQFGGNIIDASLKDSAGNVTGNDQFEEFILGTNVESSPNYQTVKVTAAGGENAAGTCETAVVQAEGPDDIFEIVNASSIIRGINIGGVPLQYPPSADDVDLPLTFRTDYSLEQGQRFVRIDTTMINSTGNDVSLYLTEYVSGSGELEIFQSGYGFGEPFVTAPCDSCRYIVHAGHNGGEGVSYGVIHDVAGTTSVSSVGVAVMLYGRDFIDVATTPEGTHGGNPNTSPNFTVPAGGELVFTRYFAVGDGNVASVLESRNRILGLSTGTVTGVVADSLGPVANAEISVLSQNDDFPANRGPEFIVANHVRTGADGRYAVKLPVGSYNLRLNVPGRLGGTPDNQPITIAADGTVEQNFTVPRASAIQVQVTDTNGQPLPAKVQLIGGDTSPDANEPLNSETVLMALTVKTGLFGDEAADPLPTNTILAEYAVNDSGSGAVLLGDTGVLPVEPGSYLLSISRGPRYTDYLQPVTITEGQTTVVNASLALVVPTPRHLSADFHVHSFQSLDAEVTDRERVATYLSEDIDFFTPSDHGFRADFTPVIAAMGVSNVIASTPSAEMTTQDYGHFNAWPTAIETLSPDSETPGLGQSTDRKSSQGSIDWGGVAPVGRDFPVYGNFNFAPQQIVAASKDDPFTAGREVVVQINHIGGHFGAGGLGIDTGMNPPVSRTNPSTRRLDPQFDDPDPQIAQGNFYTDSYDSLEVWIGTAGTNGQDIRFLGDNLGDWFNLLNQGRFHTGVANSDTHDRRISALHARNMVSVPAALLTGGPAAQRVDPHTIGDSVLAGLTTMTNAPFMVVKVKNAASQEAGLELADAFGPVTRPLPLAAPTDSVSVEIDIQSPLWAAFDRVSVYKNGATLRRTDQLMQPVSPARYCPRAPLVERNAGADFTVNTQTVPNTNSAQRLEASLSIDIANPSGNDYWLIVRAEGVKGVSPPLWPVVPNDFVDGDTLANRSAADSGVYALAVSNPIYVDANGNGQWDAPGVLTQNASRATPCPPPPNQ